MNTKFTPGPWRSEYPIVYAANGARLLTIDEYDCTTIHDARLIAAAPDLLQALRRAVLALAFAAESSPAMRDDYNAVSAAIAKATGRQD